ncbi:peptidoglycan-binding protein [Desertimonas flava]|uniref:peptidoglycan-binding protein n=1 Tax=Desertimonas flava TaxID=2064846 RepID=UPI0023F2EB7C|nr:peptidoglycan-binding protein [Desertimonas flava]
MTHDPRSAARRHRLRHVACSGLVALALGAGLAACGGDDDDAADATTAEGPVATLTGDSASPGSGPDAAPTTAGATTTAAGAATTAAGGATTAAGAATTAPGAATTATTAPAGADVAGTEAAPADSGATAAADAAAGTDAAADGTLPGGAAAEGTAAEAPSGDTAVGDTAAVEGSAAPDESAVSDGSDPAGTTVVPAEPCAFSLPADTGAGGSVAEATTTEPDGTAPAGSDAESSEPADDGPFPIVRCDTGPPVALLQQTLQLQGYAVSTIDGKFGDETDAAVRQFQADNDLEITGIVDEDTWAALAPETGGEDANGNGYIDPGEIDFSQSGFRNLG